jgi:DNA-binding winged helix-turn-helix (wHTH) protein/tetratricopeptide (TPR) repeat protein
MTPDTIQIGNLEIEPAAYRLTKAGEPLRLTPTEWALLREFTSHPNQVLTHRALLRRVWGDEYTTENDYVHTYVSRLRRKLEDNAAHPQYIVTEAGLGYRFSYDAPDNPLPPKEAAPAVPEPAPQPLTAVNPLPQHVDERFVGREAQLTQLKDLLRANTRLIGIYGRAGVGKTALVSRALSDLQQSGDFDGMVLLGAASTGITLSRVLTDFARLLGTPSSTTPEQQPVIHRVTHLLDRLRDGDYILLLDNLEPLQDPATYAVNDDEMATFLRAVLEQGSTLRILVTSRYPLNLPRTVKHWERVIALEGGLDLDDGVAFLQRSDPDGYAGLRDAPDAVLRELVKRTHGLPRALEAVAGILLETPLMAPSDLLDEEALLAEELGDLFIGETIERLGEESVHVMELASLFDRAIPVSMLQMFAQPELGGEALKPILNRLIRAYFLHYNPTNQTISMHPIDQAYCHERVPVAERSRLHQRIAALYDAQSPSQPTTITDLGDALSAVYHRVQAGDYDTAARDLLQLDERYLAIWGNYTELADPYAQMADAVHDPAVQRRVLLRQGEALRRIGRLQAAIQSYERAYILASTAGDGQHMATAVSGIAWTHYDTGQFAEAVRYWENALNIFREINDRHGEGDSLSGMGWVSYLMGSYEQGLQYLQAAFAIFGEVDNQLHRIGMNVGDSGMIQAAQGHYDAAIANLRESLSIAQQTNSLNEKSYKGGYLATVLLLAGRPGEAEAVAADAVRYEVPANQHFVWAVHGIALAQLGRTAEAVSAFEQAVTSADRLLNLSPGLYQTRYARALALAGLASLRDTPVNPVLTAYRDAMNLCAADGVLAAQHRLLSLLDAERLGEVHALFTG